MSKNKKYNTSIEFENLFKILFSPRFLNKEGLGGELPFFIHSFPIAKLSDVETNIQSLLKRLQSQGVEILEINLYKLCINILEEKEIFNQIIAQENKLPKQRLLRILSGPLSIETAIIPELNKRINNITAKAIFITGISSVYPFLRLHSIINNIQVLDKDLPVVMFFPGLYNNKSLSLFDTIDAGNDYRAHNLNDYKL
jgi:hypothetical protein